MKIDKKLISDLAKLAKLDFDDKSSLDMLKGSEVDFSEELMGASFKISNPKTKSSCGCGVSISF